MTRQLLVALRASVGIHAMRPAIIVRSSGTGTTASSRTIVLSLTTTTTLVARVAVLVVGVVSQLASWPSWLASGQGD